MKTKLFALIVFALITAGFYSCSDDDDAVKTTNVTLTFNDPADLQNPVMGKWTVALTERNSGKSYEVVGEGKTLAITVPEGDYKVMAECTGTYLLEGKTKENIFRAIKESNIIVGQTVNIVLSPYPNPEYSGNGGFLIQEVFYTGTATPEGKSYSGDKYIKIYNNTDMTLYADGLFIATTMLNTAIDYTYIPEIIDEYVPVKGIIVIPGNGKDYPIEPGKSFIITESAVNHKQDRTVDGETIKGNSNSFDLSTANWEWRNENLVNQPIDNPDVANTQSLVGNFLLHDRGYTSIIIGRLEKSQDDYLHDYTYEYNWKWIFNGVEYERGPFIDFKIPNEWVMDAVYTSVDKQDLRLVFSPTIDMDWTYCGEFDRDPNRYGKSVIRKVLSTTEDGRQILKDTNNSRVDFTPNATPSLK